MIQGFICPDGTRIDKDDCFKKCRMEEECLTIPTLMAMAYEHPWSGKPSTTQLLNGPMLNVLKIFKPYYIKPEARVYAITGIRMHSKLEEFAKAADLIAEYRLDGEITGILDLLEPDRQNGGGYVLTDNKLWGSFQLSKAIKDGDLDNETLQLNHYRVKVEQDKKLAELLEQEIKISKMRLEVIVRDGGLKAAQLNGIKDKFKMIPIERLDDDKVTDWFSKRSDELLEAIEAYKEREALPRLCDARECWNGRRCKGFCDVAEYCPRGAKKPKW